jgi:hypothetical protein
MNAGVITDLVRSMTRAGSVRELALHNEANSKKGCQWRPFLPEATLRAR